jgi:hypothetical protein
VTDGQCPNGEPAVYVEAQVEVPSIDFRGGLIRPKHPSAILRSSAARLMIATTTVAQVELLLEVELE